MKKYLPVSLWFCSLCLLGACGGGSSSSATPPPPPPIASLAITSAVPPSGTIDASYSGSGFALTATGGVTPYKWNWAALSGSSLPPGLSLSAAGMIAGTPTAAGSYNVTVTVTDSGSSAAKTSADYSITITAPGPPAISSGAPPDGTVGVEYGPSTTQYFSCVWSPILGWHLVCNQCPSYASCASLPRCTGQITSKHCLLTKQVFLGFTFTASGGVSPYSWNASGLPPQLDIDPSSGKVTGTPTTAGSYSVMVVVTDSESPPAQASATYIIDITSSSAEAH